MQNPGNERLPYQDRLIGNPIEIEWFSIQCASSNIRRGDMDRSTAACSHPDLGRPTSGPIQNKEDFMQLLVKQQ